MTCTIGFKSSTEVVIGSDSCACDTDGSINLRHGLSKVWKVEHQGLKFIVGFCGNFAEGHWLKHGFIWPKYSPHKDLMSWLVGDVQPKIAKAMRSRFEDRKDAEINFTFMLGVSLPVPRLFVLNMCGDVSESIRNFDAIGSGAQTALGCLECMESIDLKNITIEEKVLKALDISEQFNSGVRGPMYYIKL